MRLEYDATAGDNEDPSEVRRSVHELMPGTDYFRVGTQPPT
jgi:hypothetical protein